MAVQKRCFDLLHLFTFCNFTCRLLLTGGQVEGSGDETNRKLQYVVDFRTAFKIYTNLVVVYLIWFIMHNTETFKFLIRKSCLSVAYFGNTYLNSCLELCEDWNLRGTYTPSGGHWSEFMGKIQNWFRVQKDTEQCSISVNMYCTCAYHVGTQETERINTTHSLFRH